MISSSKQSVAILGARGYSGTELARLLLKHPNAQLKGVFATQSFSTEELLPELSKAQAAALAGQTTQDFANQLEQSKPPFSTVFLATPAEVSLEWAPKILKKGIRVVDLAGAFRLKGSSEADSKNLYSKWYGMNHTEAGLVQEADYGLVPFAKGEPESGLVSNPGCFATPQRHIAERHYRRGARDDSSL